ncbi:MAG: hypothetical protein AAFV25_15105, partial [Bacteroidota bacterium]
MRKLLLATSFLLMAFALMAQPGIRRPLTGLESAPDTLMIPIAKTRLEPGKYDLVYDYISNYFTPGGGDTDVSAFGLNSDTDSIVLVEDGNRFAIANSDISRFYHV